MGMLTVRAAQMRRMEASPSGRSAGQAEESATSSLTASTPLQRLALQPARSPPRPARLMLDLATHFFFKVCPGFELLQNLNGCQVQHVLDLTPSEQHLCPSSPLRPARPCWTWPRTSFSRCALALS